MTKISYKKKSDMRDVQISKGVIDKKMTKQFVLELHPDTNN